MMQIEALQLYCDVIRYGSFSQAAEDNGVTQSTASQAVQRLEEHLKVKLIDRSFRPWRVTDNGKRCHERCQQILDLYYGMGRDIGSAADEHPAELRVSSIYSVGFTYVGTLVRQYEALHPDHKLTIDYDRPEAVYRKVLENRVDLGILSHPPKRDVKVIPWRDEEMVTVCTPGHRIASRRKLSVQHLTGCSLVTFDKGLVLSKRISQFLRKHGVRVNVALRFDNIEAIKRAVEGSNHVAILPLPAVQREVDARSLVALPFSDVEFSRSLAVIHRKNRSTTQSMRQFVELLMSNAD